jgi:hypothetical protein
LAQFSSDCSRQYAAYSSLTMRTRLALGRMVVPWMGMAGRPLSETTARTLPGARMATRRAMCPPVEIPRTTGLSSLRSSMSFTTASSALSSHGVAAKVCGSGGSGGGSLPPKPGSVTAYIVKRSALRVMNES